MSTYFRETKHPQTDKWERATWYDDYYGKHHYGVKFPDGSIFDPEKIKLETREPEPVQEEHHHTQSDTGNGCNICDSITVGGGPSNSEPAQEDWMEKLKCINHRCDSNGTIQGDNGDPEQCPYCDEVLLPFKTYFRTLQAKSFNEGVARAIESLDRLELKTGNIVKTEVKEFYTEAMEETKCIFLAALEQLKKQL